MRRITCSLALGVLLAASASLTGCIVAGPRPALRERVLVPVHARVWVPGYWGPGRVWIGAHWRYR